MSYNDHKAAPREITYELQMGLNHPTYAPDPKGINAIESVIEFVTMSKSAGIENVALDDADPEKRNKALIIENDSLKDQMLEQELSLIELAKRVNVMRGVQEIGYLNPDEVRKV